MLTTTLNRIRAHSPCDDGWKKLLKYLGKTEADDEILPFSVIVESNGIDDALWCCRTAHEYEKQWRLFVVWRARQVQHLLTDKRSADAIDVAEKFANGQATKEELAAALAVARAAAWASEAAAWDDADADAEAAAWAVAGAAALAAAETAQKEKFLEIVMDSISSTGESK